MNDESVILKRIKKLLALSQHNQNEAEAASAAEKAQELLIRYNLSMESVDNTTLDKVEKVEQQRHKLNSDGELNTARWKVLLAFSVATGNLCTAIHSGRRGSTTVTWVGKPSNIEVARYMFDTLVQDLEQIADNKWKQILTLRKLQEDNPEFKLFSDPELKYIHGKSWKKSFFLGAYRAIHLRLNSGMSNLKADPNINALIVVNDKDLSEYVKTQWPRLGTYGYGGTDYDRSGYNSGYATGKDISFRKGLNGGGSLSTKQLK